MTQTQRITLSATTAVALIASLMAGCAPPATLYVPLAYRPTDTLQVPKFEGGLPPDLVLAVVVTNSRSDRVDVGQNVEKDTAVPVIPQQLTPEQFLQQAVSLELGRAGFAVVNPPANDPSQAAGATKATRVLHLDLRRFWSEESSLYRTTINVNAELQNPSGKILWQGGAAGDNQRSGRSLSPANYQESFSDAAIDLVQNLLKNEALVRALQTSDTHTPERKPRRHK